ncbi:MAG: enoyl-CoA hydratase [Burkholderiales bacterium PBB5]|nr:MAG: enoyl-CoA hydratase [Burkholderiales bacterium PBB5]
MSHPAPVPTTTASATLDITRHGAVARVFLNRPEVRNAFNSAVIAELTAAFATLGADDGVRAIVLGGHGKAFCAGGDLNWMRAMADYSWACPKPVVGRLQGDCYAGGMGLAACCDVLVAAEGLHFCLSEAKLGLLPATIGPYVIKALGEQAARRYFITAERFSATEAHRLGFVHALAAPEALDATVDGVVAALLANGPAAVAASKRLVQDLAGAPITEALRADTARRIADIRASSEGKEGVQSFLSKRNPAWKLG